MNPALLFVAAEKAEFEGVLRRVSKGRRREWGLDFAWEGEWRGRRWLLAANGAGPRLAGAAVERVCSRTQVGVVVSTGYCGGLDVSLRPGAVVVADRVWDAEGCVEYSALLPEHSGGYRRGSIISIDRVIAGAGERRRLAALGASAVEMEAAGVARRARDRGLKFYCVRAVTDCGGENLRFDFNTARDAEGRLLRSRVVAGALRRPLVYFPELIKLFRRSRTASAALGEFLVQCEFQV